jgi:adenylate kinase
MPSWVDRFGLVFLAMSAAAAAQMRPADIIILIGPPGSGKSIQAEHLRKTYKVPAISMETVLKEEIGKKTPLGKALASSLASGELVGDEAANQIIQARLLRKDAARGFILDGYPATEEQARALDDFLSEQSFSKPIVVIIEAPDNVIRERMKRRRRADDTPDNIERRIREYRQLGAFTEKWYGSDRTVRVDGTGSIQTVALAISQQIDNARSKKELTVRPPQDDGLKE